MHCFSRRKFWGPATERDAYIALLSLLTRHPVKLTKFSVNRANVFDAVMYMEIEGRERSDLDAFLTEFDAAIAKTD